MRALLGLVAHVHLPQLALQLALLGQAGVEVALQRDEKDDGDAVGDKRAVDAVVHDLADSRRHDDEEQRLGRLGGETAAVRQQAHAQKHR